MDLVSRLLCAAVNVCFIISVSVISLWNENGTLCSCMEDKPCRHVNAIAVCLPTRNPRTKMKKVSLTFSISGLSK